MAKKKTKKKQNIVGRASERLRGTVPVSFVHTRLSHVSLFIRRSQPLQVVFLFITVLFTCGALVLYFEHKGNKEVYNTFFDALWYGIVTMTTTGYGDKFPLSLPGRLVGIFMMIGGVLTMAMFSAFIVSFMVERRLAIGKGLVGLSNMENHFIVCGWKKDLGQLLHDIMAVNPAIKPENVVLINKADASVIEDLKGDPDLASVKFIYGDHNDENVLLRAGVRGAKTVLLLADQVGNPTPMETDSRTVMAAMTVEALNKQAYTCAELLDPKFEKHLKLSDCDEIILSRDHNRVLLANASSATGISHVIDALIGVNSPNPITVVDFPKRLVGKTFKDLKEFFTTEYNDIVIGVLENTGNLFLRKQEALKDAQKTPDISKLVENLQIVKKIRGNDPMMNPGDDYVIQKNSKAIIIKCGAEKNEQTG